MSSPAFKACPRIPTGNISLGAYIFYRLREIGISHILGCPGDFNLNLLDHLYTVPGIKWIGTCNELNAAYAADGYARVRGIPSALITTYGVGELSAINGVAGAYSEHVPIIHIVGTTSRLARKDRIMIHHTLREDWDHDTFQKMSEPVRSASAFLLRDSTFTKDVDEVLEKCVRSRRPVYLYVPMDVPDILVDSKPLEKPLDLEIRNEGSEDQEDAIVEEIIAALKKSQNPTVLVDVLAQRYGALDDVVALLESTMFPAFVTPLSKSHVDETSISFAGLYNGKLTPNISVKQQIEGSDAVIHIGPLLSDSNTGGWSQNLRPSNLISLGHDRIQIRGRTWSYIHFAPILKKLVSRIQLGGIRLSQRSLQLTKIKSGHKKQPSGPLEQHYFWKQFSSFVKPGDCIIAEVGSAQYGTLEIDLPHDTTFFTQLYYSSIGFTVGALLGALLARREQGKKGRVLLFIGDGSLHMSVQELSTVIRNGFNPTIILINNSGYTIERVIHGPSQLYNDISEDWDYQNMLKFFGAKNARSYSARTYEELFTVLENRDFIESKSPQLLEVFMDKYDAPWMLTGQVNIVQSKFGKQLRDWDKANGRERLVLDKNLYQSKHALMDSHSYQFVAKQGQSTESAPLRTNRKATDGFKPNGYPSKLRLRMESTEAHVNGYQAYGGLTY